MLMPWISVSKTYFKFRQIIKIMFEKVGCWIGAVCWNNVIGWYSLEVTNFSEWLTVEF